jgi:hypothetical protein
MRLSDVLALALLAMSLEGCSSGFSARAASPTTVPVLAAFQRVDTTDHLVYEGSDQSWHYFYHSRLFDGGSYKIPRSTLVVVPEHPIQDNRSELVTGKFKGPTDGVFSYKPYEPDPPTSVPPSDPIR